jgi:Calpain large subunit, domain III
MCMRARRTIAAEWGEGSAGGCHLHPDTWKKNPCFHLKLKAPGPTRVRVVLSRPDKDWRAACHSDSVGCMMGFYLLQGSRPVRTPGALFHEGRPWDESPFVPTHRFVIYITYIYMHVHCYHNIRCCSAHY